jgi:8-oxo-dGTP diphosphatase
MVKTACVTDPFDIADEPWARQFPALFRSQPFQWGGIGDRRLQISFSRAVPADDLISNVKIIARCGRGIVVIETADGWRSLPGGTREPDEAWEMTAARELAEETGGRLVGAFDWIGAFEVDHSSTGRYRPHLPFPISYWAYVAADVELGSAPSNPIAGEQVTAVQVLPVEEAIEYLAVFDSGPTLDIIRLARRLGITPVAADSAEPRRRRP